MSKDYAGTLKIIVVGNTFTGKTSFIKQWVKGAPPENYKATVMSEFNIKIFHKNNQSYQVQIWDLAGQDRNAFVSKFFTRDCVGAVVICATDDKKSIDDAIEWRKVILNEPDIPKDLPMILIQNKSDLLENEEENFEDMKGFSEKNGFVNFYRTSAKNGKNVNEAMEHLVNIVIDRFESEGGKEKEEKKQKDENLKVNAYNYRGQKKDRSKGCC